MSLPLEQTIVCPGCAAKFKLAEGTRNADVLQIARLAAVFGPDWSAVESYLACFRTAAGKGIKPERLRVILEELVEIWQRKAFSYDGKNHNVDALLLRSMIRQIGQKCDEKYGFKNHNYLKSALANELPKHNAAASVAERREIERDRTGASRQDEENSLMPETLAMLEHSRQEREARLSDQDRETLTRKAALKSPRPAPVRPADYAEARERTIADLRQAGKSEEEIARLLPE